MIFTGLIGPLFVSCEKAPWQDCYKGQGERVETKRTLPPHTDVEFNIAAQLYITYDTNITQPEISIRAQKNVADRISTEVNDLKLSIDFRECLQSHDEIDIFLKTPYVKNLILKGPGRLTTENAIAVDSVSLLNDGTGFLTAIIDGDFCKSTINSAGEITVSGSSKVTIINSFGSGKYSGFLLAADSAVVTNAAAGLIEVFASDSMLVSINGIGNVNYRGTAGIQIVSQSGAGQIINSN